MTPRDLVTRALRFESPPRVPRQAWVTPWAERRFPAEVARLRAEFPDDILVAPARYRSPIRVVGQPFQKGLYVDEWGCRFENPYDGLIGRVSEPILAGWAEAETYQPPAALLDLDTAAIDGFCRETDRFVLSGTIVRPFERLGFLRGFDRILVDLVERRPPFLALLDRVGRHAAEEAAAWAATGVDAIFLMDDWGARDRLLVAPSTWRALFKPVYREICRAAHGAGTFVFMHSDGWILDIVPDLIEAGVDALNCQAGWMGEDRLGAFRGQITIWGEIDRHDVLARGSIDEVRRAVDRARQHFWHGGGAIAQCEFGPGARPENVAEVFRCWDEALRL
jgi:hypothetical protein